MKLKEWYTDRGLKFVFQRGSKLLGRYSLVPGKAMRRIECCVATLSECGCAPTFPTPGILVERYPDFIRSLQDQGAEIAVHGYRHVNLNGYPLEEARRQLEKAAEAFERLGIRSHGFRGPYIGCSDELIDFLPIGLFGYSSNKAIRWRSPNEDSASQASTIYTTIDTFYQATDSTEKVCVPWNCSHLVEIPVCIPDDLQVLDGLQLSTEDLTQSWQQMLHQTNQRGELFTLLFHTELAGQCEQPLVDLLCTARAYRPPVWIARLHEISDWWREKSQFNVAIATTPNGLMLTFDCSSRATILVRGLDSHESGLIWDNQYSRLQSNTLEVQANPRPFIGITDDIPERVVSFLRNQGYILDTGETARLCGLILDTEILSRLLNDVELVTYIEASAAPLVRYWRWPNGARSAMSITGDLDALSLMDYASRLFS
jgi:hypothetical protein